MSNPIDFSEYKNRKELEMYCVAQYSALEAAVTKIKTLEDEINHLKTLLDSTIPSVEKIIKSPELCLVEAQINLLTKRAMTKELTLEETKQLDLLIKNKRLLSDQATTIEGNKKPKKEFSEAQLISLARIEKK